MPDDPNPFDELGDLDFTSEGDCVCCAGRYDPDDTIDPNRMCEGCLAAWVEFDDCPHPTNDIEALAATPSHVVSVEPVVHKRGKAWHWKAAVEADAAGCGLCRPTVPCWRHQAPALDLVGCRLAEGWTIYIYSCTLGEHRRAADVPCTGDGGIAVEPHGGELVVSVCGPCAVAHVGRQVDAVCRAR